MTNQDLIARDLNVLWHPCTQMKDTQQLPPIPMRRGEGVWLEDFDGNRYIDAVSSWWVNIFGHANPAINARIKTQLDTIEHVMLAGFTHEPAVELAERLVDITPPGLDKVFYADNGSAAVEVALKMSFHYWRNTGHGEKTRFINLSNSYHGETLGALAVGDVSLYKKTYEPLLLKPLTARSPDCFHREPGMSWEEHSRLVFADMEALLAEHAHETCAVIVEPLLQCAGHMRMYHPVYLELLREACDRYNVHLIADEIATGFGRTGTLFACEQAGDNGITPDFMCLSKGITAGYLPMSVAMTTNEIYDAFYDEYENLTAFLHSHSYTGNPLACAAALATLDEFAARDQINANRVLSERMAQATAPLADHPNVAEVRQTGMVLAIEMVKNKASRTPFDWRERRGLRVYRHGLTRQSLLRPLGDTIYFMPPYVISPEQIDHLAEVAAEGIDHAVST
ncbi:adenosylmethionine--8-amino-7-oxononanoate transaminase [Salinisphaera hydrothermalis]|uniref:Adenosylmethionine-8-amino-7-oxononanoate aminotransferase n=1 Tax=Salinisphaera hydrothermalis (strain C41B8) TaxID=1304275 RepID=A0A084IJT8_SALHC|nr:adenosylmethionine--8-amino-7-oxononanoate transaminase [Salinisphaera hydrothermalis]KEZ76972.1 adenosylmethionine--8-amino-7-oxononanoate transaminase [Salinisphaera hydrothermalis C41B8]